MGIVMTVGRKIDVDDLVTAADIAARLPAVRQGKSKGSKQGPQVVHTWIARYEDFPEPLREIGGRKVWSWGDVKKWMRQRDREWVTPSGKPSASS